MEIDVLPIDGELAQIDHEYNQLRALAMALRDRFFEEAKALCAEKSTADREIRIRTAIAVRVRSEQSWQAVWVRLKWKEQGSLKFAEIPKDGFDGYHIACFHFCANELIPLIRRYEKGLRSIRAKAAENRAHRRLVTFRKQSTAKEFEALMAEFEIKELTMTPSESDFEG